MSKQNSCRVFGERLFDRLTITINMSDATWQYVTLSSGDSSNPGISKARFFNALPMAIAFPTNHVQVSLVSITTKNAGSQVAVVNSDCVIGSVMVGSEYTNSLRRFVLGSGLSTYEPFNTQWYPAVTTGGTISFINITVTDVDGKDITTFTDDTFVTLAFRSVEK